MEEATEAPALDEALPVEEAMTEAATEEPAPEETEEPETEAPPEETEAPPASIPNPLPTVTIAADGGMDIPADDIQATERANGAVGGMGPGETEATSGEEQRLLTAESEVPATAPEPLQIEGEHGGESDAAASLSPDELTQPKAYTMAEATVTATPSETWGGGRIAKLSAKWAIPLVGVLVLVGLLVVAAVIIRRQRD